eukprot:CAMPEP_0194493622 /NCGR_PEP_ID=MMETSP0253-20130528/11777_1 /TAXON_ID=2966 /ORGANISM="Noctiluca scintillans" /LENGTH=180 /DNA_ID=CAMNT_0039334629 /DNA_START=139 /DNA_END=682 /DNA_ORIENTATION=-
MCTDIRRPIHVSTRALGHNSPSDKDCHPRKIDSEKIQGDRPRNQRAGASAHRNVVAVGGTRARESTFLSETPTPLAHKHFGLSPARPSPVSGRRCLANVSDEKMRPPHPVGIQLERLLWCEFEKTVAAEKGDVVKHSVSNVAGSFEIYPSLQSATHSADTSPRQSVVDGKSSTPRPVGKN